MNVKEATMSFHNDEILEKMEYRGDHQFHISKIKTKVLNIYPKIQGKLIPFIFISQNNFFFTLNKGLHLGNCTCLISLLHLFPWD